MNPRKFNYFNIFSADMETFAAISFLNLMISRTTICCGHIVIAVNRLTAFYLPVKQERVSLCISSSRNNMRHIIYKDRSKNERVTMSSELKANGAC